MVINELVAKRLEELHQSYDEKAGLIGTKKTEAGGGYHTKRTGDIHETNLAAEYASAVIYMKAEDYYDRVNRIFLELVKLQDADPESRTFGLWPYYMEENLSEMLAPDYNWSNFIGKHFIYGLTEGGACITMETREIMRTALRNAMECSIRRNVSPDYTNISMMSAMVIISAGELLEDERLFTIGKERFQKAYAYNKFNGAFSEYNSSTYTPLAIAELTRMLQYFKDPECRRMAEELHEMAWENISLYYNPNMCEIAPPQKRCYRDLDDGQYQSLVYLATDGRYGRLHHPEKLILSFLTLPFHCPEKLYPNFELPEERWIEKTYYRKNAMRTPDEDTVIVRNINSPDLKAFTYMTKQFSAGAFDKSDLWNQRRTSMVTWGTPDAPRCMRIRCINGDYDFCSGVISTDMEKNVMLSHIGFVSDHGDFHYILDKKKDGVIETDRLCFRFEFAGETQNISIEQKDGRFVIRDGEMTIRLHILKWVYDGKPGRVLFDAERKVIELCGYAGERTAIDLKQVKESYGVFTLAVMAEEPICSAEVQGGVVLSKANADRELTVRTYTGVKAFDEFMELK